MTNENHLIDNSNVPETAVPSIDNKDVQEVSTGGLMNWIRKHKRATAGIGVGTIAAVGGGAALVANIMRGPSDSPNPVHTSTSETTASPSATPTPVETQTPTAVPDAYPFKVDQATIAPYLSESQGDFLTLDTRERALVPLYYAENMPKFAADWYSVSQNPLDNELPAQITMDMTPQQIVTFNVYLHRIAATIPDPTDPNGYKMDENAADKMVAGYLTNPNTSRNYGTYISKLDEFAHDGSGVSSARTLAVSGIYYTMATADPTSSTEILHDPQGPYRNIRTVEADGSSSTDTYRWVVATNGVGLWLLQN